MMRLFAIAALAACAQVQPAPAPEGPFICACAKKPEAPATPQKWDT